jgi:hypothetical protein
MLELLADVVGIVSGVAGLIASAVLVWNLVRKPGSEKEKRGDKDRADHPPSAD